MSEIDPYIKERIEAICERIVELNAELVVNRLYGRRGNYIITPRTEFNRAILKRKADNRRKRLWRERD